ncbi:hypothetical protein NDU88_003403 [Pleurodeles waltl]|uniref:Uncharacterized protein n=1 Tax=Pleurodeles waltl TaxID=8319 RepID=A0AAV7W5W8_PLEWA|nr:hypothetical protein NDU88_003403 [Pleurodeles waltl]
MKKLKDICKKRGLNVGRNAFNVDLQVAIRACEVVNWLHATTEVENPELQDAQDGAGSSVSTRGLSQMELDINTIESYTMAELRK